MNKKIGVDVGGTKIAAGVVSNGKVMNYNEVKTPSTKKAFLKAMFFVIDFVFDKKVSSIGVGFPAPVVDGVVLEVQNIKSLDGMNLKRIIEKKYKVKCTIENDAHAFALAESKSGSAKGKKNVIGITLGTGLGCGIVINGSIYSGNTGAAGELSRIPHNGKTYEDTVNIRFIKKMSGKDPKELFLLAKQGNKKALKAWAMYGKNLGRILAAVVDAYDPSVIVLGGSISGAYAYFAKYLKPEMKKYCFRNSISKVKIVKSKLKNSGVIGAAML